MNLKQILSAIAATAIFVGAAAAQNEIKPGKAVQITIKGVPAEEQGKIDGQYPVGDDGTVNLPYIGAIRAAGLKPGDLAASIQSSYRSQGIYRTPTIQVFSNREGGDVEEQVVTVGGEVRRTGPVKYTLGLTLWQAIQAAGGATEFGSVKRVTVFRNGNSVTYNVTQPKFMSIPLFPGDTISIPQKTILGQ